MANGRGSILLPVIITYWKSNYETSSSKQKAVPLARQCGHMSKVHVQNKLIIQLTGIFPMLSSCSLPADIHAVLLSDVILLLQEKDQKFVFAAVVSHPAV